MTAKRMRVFAGPNGSGKTTIFKAMLAEANVNLGVYVNADEIEKTLQERGSIDFSDYKLIISESQLHDFFRNSTFSPVKREESSLWTKLTVTNSVVTLNTTIDSYLAADLAEFILQ